MGRDNHLQRCMPIHSSGTLSVYAPRVGCTLCSCHFFLFPQAIRIVLSNENKRRDAEAEVQSTDTDEVYIVETLDDGTKVERRVDKVTRAYLFIFPH